MFEMLNSLFISLCFILLNFEIYCQNLDAHRFQSMIRSDTNALKRVLHNSLIYIHSNGLQESKTDFLSSIISEKIVYQKFQFVTRKRIIKSSTRLVFRGIVIVDGLYENQSFQVKLAFTSMYKINRKRFQLIYWQSTKL